MTSRILGDTFHSDMLVRFSHCDPAGIVFYPQYFIMFNGLVEDWFNQGLGVNYARYITEHRLGFPIVKLECDFVAPSKIGEIITFGLRLETLGRSSLAIAIDCRYKDEQRLRAKFVLVAMDLAAQRARPLPEDLRTLMLAFQQGQFDINNHNRRDSSMQTFNPPGWKRPKGYSNVVSSSGRMVFVAGQVGWDSQEIFRTEDLVGQVRQSLTNIVAILAEAGARPEHIVRMNWYLEDKEEYNARLGEIGDVYRDLIGRHFPAMTALQVAGFVELGAKVEIEVTAMLPG